MIKIIYNDLPCRFPFSLIPCDGFLFDIIIFKINLEDSIDNVSILALLSFINIEYKGAGYYFYNIQNKTCEDFVESMNVPVHCIEVVSYLNDLQSSNLHTFVFSILQEKESIKEIVIAENLVTITYKDEKIVELSPMYHDYYYY